MLKTPDMIKAELKKIGMSKEQFRQVERVFRNYRFVICAEFCLIREKKALLNFAKIMKATE